MSNDIRETHYVPDVVPDSDLAYFEGSDPTIGWGGGKLPQSSC